MVKQEKCKSRGAKRRLVRNWIKDTIRNAIASSTGAVAHQIIRLWNDQAESLFQEAAANQSLRIVTARPSRFSPLIAPNDLMGEGTAMPAAESAIGAESSRSTRSQLKNILPAQPFQPHHNYIPGLSLYNQEQQRQPPNLPPHQSLAASPSPFSASASTAKGVVDFEAGNRPAPEYEVFALND